MGGLREICRWQDVLQQDDFLDGRYLIDATFVPHWENQCFERVGSVQYNARPYSCAVRALPIFHLPSSVARFEKSRLIELYRFCGASEATISSKRGSPRPRARKRVGNSRNLFRRSAAGLDLKLRFQFCRRLHVYG
jgi:hypothetical protein